LISPKKIKILIDHIDLDKESKIEELIGFEEFENNLK